MTAESARQSGSWISRTVVGVILATFFSDFSHEMATAVLPLYLASIGLGPAALGAIEGIADFIVSVSKLAGGIVGHHVRSKRAWASAGYLLTTVSTAGMAFAHGAGALVGLRSAAWVGRGFRGPLRDHVLADAVEPTHYGRAFGLERAGDMLGAVLGPLVAAGCLAAAVGFRTVLLWTIVPGLVAASSMYFLARERRWDADAPAPAGPRPKRPPFPRQFWWFTGAVLLFGLGDFSRTFLVWLAAAALGEKRSAAGSLSIAVLLYVLHNFVAAVSAYPAGHLGDRRPKLTVLTVGYALGVATNVLLAVDGASIAGLVVAIALSGVYISIEEAVEKAAAVEILPRELRSLGLGILACANAVGDMASSLWVGFQLERGAHALAFGGAAAAGALGAVAMAVVGSRGAKGA